MIPFTREELIACVEREIRMRERVYPDRVAMGKMSGASSLREVAMMRAVLDVLLKLPTVPPVQQRLFR